MLVGDGIKQPGRIRLHRVLFTFAHTLPVPELIPLLIFDDPFFQIGFALLVPLQNILGLMDLLSTDGLNHRQLIANRLGIGNFRG